ncbi:DUF3466 family protein [Shewanella intestini]|uniref:DUF3466 family protein n=1 Tax=Shewanella intestini TaxID=2017544 RepID=A0ABS5I0D3_9GAMM|nr:MULTISPECIES: DUF3466 family protein [Shewanella]MBR9727485.1 DUF3466 family protein [Shewanella intestini]MRG35465.1 DUF3466 family protein [Shewanella sp. XMDDZSB0408]
MKLTLDKTLSLVALGVIASLSQVQAAPVYQIQNIKEVLNSDNNATEVDIDGTLENTSNGYGMALNGNNELVGISKGKTLLNDDDINDGIIDPEDGLLPEERITYSVYSSIKANNFGFTAQENDPNTAWTPTFFSVAGTTEPSDTDNVNSIDSFLYGVNANNTVVGARSAIEKKLDYVGELEDQDFWYYRDFETRGFANVNGTEFDIVPPYTTYTYEETEDLPEQDVNVGGFSVLSAVNDNDLATGYVSTDLAEVSKSRVNACVESTAESQETDSPVPLDVCIQTAQYPDNSGFVNIQYQVRAGVWDLSVLDDSGHPTFTQLPLGLEPEEDSTITFTAQGLGVNNNGDVAGRSHVYRDDGDTLYQDAAFWRKNDAGEYEYHHVPMNNDLFSSIAYDINDSGILIGRYTRYINGYTRDKFFTYDTNDESAEIVTPNDFEVSLSELSSTPKDINNAGMVVGNIEVTYDKDKPRPKAGFLYNNNDNEFVNLNNTLTCDSKGYVLNDDNQWERSPVTVIDGDGKELTYDSNFYITEANHIQEDGTIVGTAFVRKPVYQTDDDGNLILGDNGKPYFELNGNGQPITTNKPRMVVLKPVQGLEACTVVDETDTDKPYERKGAASFAWLLALPVLWLRRRSLQVSIKR